MADRPADPSRRPALLPLVGAAVLVPTVLSGLTQLWPRPQIEDQLTRTGGGALAAAGFPGAGLIVSGRDATISGINPADAQRAIAAVQAVPGIRVAAAPDVEAGTAPAPAAATAPFGVARRGEAIVLAGVVGSVEERARLVEAAAVRARGRVVVDELTVTAGAALPTGVSPTSVEATAAALAGPIGTDTAISIDDGGAAVRGSAADESARNAVVQAVAAALPGLAVAADGLRVDRAAAGSAVTAAGPAAPTGLDTAARQRLQDSISRQLSAAPLTFRPDSPKPTKRGRAALVKVVKLISATPGARLQVDGYVATGPSAGRFTAQQLSGRRAAAVRRALVAAGVPARNIVIRGLGEGDRPAAGAAGRRVEITVV